MADMTPSVLANAIMAKIEANASFRALTAAPVDARDLFVLGFVCRKLKRSPNPDPTLFPS